jgi:hypothetical protein
LVYVVFQNRASHLQYLSSEANFDFWELMIFLVDSQRTSKEDVRILNPSQQIKCLCLEFWTEKLKLLSLNPGWPGLTHKTRDPVILPGQLPGWVL